MSSRSFDEALRLDRRARARRARQEARLVKREAFLYVRTTGKLDRLADRIWIHVSQHPDGMVPRDIAEDLGVHPNEITQPLADLERDGRLWRRGKRPARASNVRGFVYYAVEPTTRAVTLEGFA